MSKSKIIMPIVILAVCAAYVAHAKKKTLEAACQEGSRFQAEMFRHLRWEEDEK